MQYKPSNEKPAGQLQTTEVKALGEMIGVDFMGPLPLSKAQNSVLMVVVDYYTKWVELFALKDAKTPKVCQVLKNDIFTRWGVPNYLVAGHLSALYVQGMWQGGQVNLRTYMFFKPVHIQTGQAAAPYTA